MNSGALQVPDNVLISIIIATFNAGKHLRDCLASIESLTEKRIEVVISDGGSTDDTLSIVKEFQQRLFITCNSAPDKGIYDAMNKGVQLAKGRWVHFLGADDRVLPGFSELAAQLQDEHTVYYGNSTPYYGDSGLTPLLLIGKFSNYRLAKHCMNHQAIIYPIAAFRKYQYNLRYKVYADYAMNIRLWGDRAFKKVFHPVNVVQYDMTGFSSITNDIPFKQDKLQLIRESMGWMMYLRMLYKRYKKKLQGEKDFWGV
ncbi:glycosyltransferase [Chitinophaga agrisoli]|uniref:Glycosyltransferase n=1 Tax=Chitinophaga agrisoli TaxID=2607653 RepID=A0A5B2VX12_9BACT|nr:glycosyltransferase family 2 protein [Chitinophaga agrisoli]KAA2242569.1 glycosyltransferase [Chitinophaga agrisoli]